MTHPSAGTVLSFNNCVYESDGVRINGTMRGRLESYSGNPLDDNYDSHVRIHYIVDRFKVETLGTTDYSLQHGAFVLDKEHFAGVADNIEFSTWNDLKFYSEEVIDGHREQTLLQNFYTRATENHSTGEATLDKDATVSSTRIGGKAVVETTTRFRIPDSSHDYPQEGQVIVTAAGGAKIRLTAIGSDQIRLEYDLDGDGVYDDGEITKLWSAL